MADPNYEVYAIKYATRNAFRHDHFIGGDPHDAPMPMDYFVWLIRSAERTFIVDTGFTREVGEARKRTFLRSPAEGLALMGVKAADVENVIITHLHYDHVGTFHDFPRAQFHLQDDEMAFATGGRCGIRGSGTAIEVEDVVGMVQARVRATA